MTRWICACMASLLIVFSVGMVGLTACGDKFLRFGRSARHNAYAAIHPASILVYVPANAKPSEVRAFEATLKRAGHRPLAVRSMDAFLDVVATNAYDIVIANLLDAPRLRERAGSAPSQPLILPIVYKPKKAMLAEIKREYGHFLEEGADRSATLAEIDHAMQDRVSGRP